MTALGIDIGSTSIKGAVLGTSPTGQPLVGAVAKAPFPKAVTGLAPGCFEIDPHLVLQATRQVLDSLVQQAPKANRLYLCGQMGGAVVCDSSGHPLTRYLSWRDQRATLPETSGHTLLQAATTLLEDILPEIGNELKPGSTTLLLHALKRAGHLPQGVPATIGDAVAAMLTGTAPRIHPTMAIGLLDLIHGGWPREMLRRLGIEHLDWQELPNLVQPLGTTRCQNTTLEVFAVVGDQQSALYGAGLQPGELSLNVSTGAQVSRLVKHFAPVAHQTRHFLDGMLLETITHIPAGRSLHALVDLLTELSRAQNLPVGNPWQTITRLAAQAPEDAAGLAANIAFFPSTVGDYGNITGIRLENLTAGNLLAAATRDLAGNLATCADRLDPEAYWPTLRLSGGLNRDLPLLTRLIQSRFPKATLIESTQEEETLAGLARIAAA